MTKNIINAAVVNLGAGSVKTGNIEITNLHQIIGEESQKEELMKCFSRLNDEINKLDNQDLKDSMASINEECAKSSWAKKTLRIGLNAIKSIASDIAASQLTNIVTEALGKLG